MRTKWSDVLGALLVTVLAHAATADTLTDGKLVVNIDNSGEFNVVSLNGLDIDTSSFVQQYVGATCSGGFSGGSAVNVVGTTATYTATCGDFDVAVTTRILGPLPSDPTNSDVLEQQLVFTNNTDVPQSLETVSNMDQDLVDSEGDIVAFNPAGVLPSDFNFPTVPVQAVVATDVTEHPSRLMAAIATTLTENAVLGWDVDFLGSQSTSFPMDNGVGPVGPGDTAMSLGFEFPGSVGSEQSRTVSFRYLFQLGATKQSAAPTLSHWGLAAIIVTLAGFGMLRLRRQA